MTDSDRTVVMEDVQAASASSPLSSAVELPLSLGDTSAGSASFQSSSHPSQHAVHSVAISHALPTPMSIDGASGTVASPAVREIESAKVGFSTPVAAATSAKSQKMLNAGSSQPQGKSLAITDCGDNQEKRDSIPSSGVQSSDQGTMLLPHSPPTHSTASQPRSVRAAHTGPHAANSRDLAVSASSTPTATFRPSSSAVPVVLLSASSHAATSAAPSRPLQRAPGGAARQVLSAGADEVDLRAPPPQSALATAMLALSGNFQKLKVTTTTRVQHAPLPTSSAESTAAAAAPAVADAASPAAASPASSPAPSIFAQWSASLESVHCLVFDVTRFTAGNDDASRLQSVISASDDKLLSQLQAFAPVGGRRGLVPLPFREPRTSPVFTHTQHSCTVDSRLVVSSTLNSPRPNLSTFSYLHASSRSLTQLKAELQAHTHSPLCTTATDIKLH